MRLEDQAGTVRRNDHTRPFHEKKRWYSGTRSSQRLLLEHVGSTQVNGREFGGHVGMRRRADRPEAHKGSGVAQLGVAPQAPNPWPHP